MKKMMIKRLVDVLMTLVLFMLMGFMVTGQELHEWFGTGMLLLVFFHNILNYRWYSSLKKGTYGACRIVWVTLNFLLLIAIISAAMSGIAMSGYVYSFLDLGISMSFAREAHLASVYWSFLLMSLHLGLHWEMIMGAARKMSGLTTPNRVRRICLRLTVIILSFMGAEAWWRHDLFSYMTMKNMFAFFDFEQPVFHFFMDYLNMMILWGCIAHYIGKLLHHISVQISRGKGGNTLNWGREREGENILEK